MITYKYNLLVDIKGHRYRKRKATFLEKENIYLVKFGIFKYFKFLFDYFTGKLYLPQIKTPFNITCYLMSCGNWGSYHVPNVIEFCPLELKHLNMTTEELLHHEITHLLHEKDVQGMTHKEKEDYINNKSKY